MAVYPEAKVIRPFLVLGDIRTMFIELMVEAVSLENFKDMSEELCS